MMTYPKDEFVVYRAPEDEGQFIAHSIRTDQIGMADTVGGAMYELLVALQNLYTEHARNPEIRVERTALESVQRLYFNSDPLPEPYWEEAKARLVDPSLDQHARHNLASEVVHGREVSEVTYYGLILRGVQADAAERLLV